MLQRVYRRFGVTMLSLAFGVTALAGLNGQAMANTAPTQDDFFECMLEAAASCEEAGSEDEVMECLLNAISSCLGS